MLAVPLLLLAAPGALAQSSNETAALADTIEPVAVEPTDPEMNAAIAEARRTLPEFLALLENPPAGAREFVIKFPLGGWEHIWVRDLVVRGDTISGRLDNIPIQEGYREGDRVNVPLSEVSDWAWRGADGVVRGHRTTRVLLPRLDPGDAASVREYFGWD